MRSFQSTQSKVTEVLNLHQYRCQNLKSCIFNKAWGLGVGVWSEVSFKNYTQNFFIRDGPAYKKICCAMWVSIRQCAFPTMGSTIKIVGQMWKNFETSMCCEKKIPNIPQKTGKNVSVFSDTHTNSLQINSLRNDLEVIELPSLL